MAIRANPKLIEELEPYGAEDVMKCYHCGNCSAVCPFSKRPLRLPPQTDALPADGARGEARRAARPLALLLLRGVLRPVPARRRAGRDDDEPAALAHVALRLDRDLAPLLPLVALGARRDRAGGDHHGDRLHAVRAVAGQPRRATTGPTPSCPARASTSSTGRSPRCCWRSCSATRHACGGSRWAATRTLPTSLGSYVSSIWMLPAHFLTQARYSQCERKGPWLTHLALMLSYVTMLVLIMFFLAEMASGPGIDWRVHVLGYLATAGLVVSTILFLRNRVEEVGGAVQALARVGLDLPRPDPRRSRSPGSCSTSCTAAARRGGQRDLHRAPVAGRPDARARGAVQQVVAPGLSPAGHVPGAGAGDRAGALAQGRRSGAARRRAG